MFTKLVVSTNERNPTRDPASVHKKIQLFLVFRADEQTGLPHSRIELNRFKTHTTNPNRKKYENPKIR